MQMVGSMILQYRTIEFLGINRSEPSVVQV